MHALDEKNRLVAFIPRWIMLLLGVSLLVGSCGAAFLHALEWTTDFFKTHLPWSLLGLPFLGLVTVGAYRTFAASSDDGINVLRKQIQSPQEVLPGSMAPSIFASTLLSHLGGASVGREGTALQMGGACADQFSRWFQLTPKERQTLLLCGVSAGFAVVFGTPFGAAIFALEFIRRRSWQFIPCLFTAFVADEIGQKIFGVQHADYHPYFLQESRWTIQGLGWAILLGVGFGLAARLYLKASRESREGFARIHNPYYRILLGAVSFAVIILWIDGVAYTGLGLRNISMAFTEPLPAYFWILKLLLTALCLAAGFKGGEVTPLFCIGATLGATLAPYTNLPLASCVGLGFVSVFAGAGAVPVACSVIAWEMFGFTTGAYALVACAVSSLVAGKQRLYTDT